MPKAKPTLKLDYSDGTSEELTIPGAKPGQTAEQAFISYCKAREAQAKKDMALLKSQFPELFK